MRHVEFQHDAFYCIYNIFNYPFIPILVYSSPYPNFITFMFIMLYILTILLKCYGINFYLRTTINKKKTEVI